MSLQPENMQELMRPADSVLSARESESAEFVGESLVDLADIHDTILDYDVYKQSLKEAGHTVRLEVDVLLNILRAGKPADQMAAMDKIRERLFENLKLQGRIRTVSRKTSISAQSGSVVASQRTIAILQAGRREADRALAITNNPIEPEDPKELPHEQIGHSTAAGGSLHQDRQANEGRGRAVDGAQPQPHGGGPHHSAGHAPGGRAGGRTGEGRHPRGTGSLRTVPSGESPVAGSGHEGGHSGGRKYIPLSQRGRNVRRQATGIDLLASTGTPPGREVSAVQLVAAAVDPALVGEQPAPIPVTLGSQREEARAAKSQWTPEWKEPDDPKTQANPQKQSSDPQGEAANTAGHRPPTRNFSSGLCRR